MVQLGLHHGHGPASLAEIAQDEDLPQAYLEQLVMSLREAGLVRSTRGARGGYELARERRRITAASILRAVSSAAGGDPGEAPDCLLVRQVVAPIVEAAGKVFLDKLETITIDDICRRAEDLKLCDEKGVSAGTDFTI